MQVVEDGYEFFADRQLVTIFSAPNYCGEFDNAGALMGVDETLMCSFQILKPTVKKSMPNSRGTTTGKSLNLPVMANFGSTVTAKPSNLSAGLKVYKFFLLQILAVIRTHSVTYSLFPLMVFFLAPTASPTHSVLNLHDVSFFAICCYMKSFV